MKKSLITVAVLLVVTGAASLFASGSDSSMALVPSGQLDQVIAAGCEECCDPTGSWNNCAAVPHQCTTQAPEDPPGEMETAFGVICTDEQEECTYANEGADNAQCEGGATWWDNCWYTNPGPCNAIMKGTCKTNLRLDPIYDPFHEVIGHNWFYTCDCANAVQTGQNSMTRINCAGDGCWI